MADLAAMWRPAVGGSTEVAMDGGAWPVHGGPRPSGGGARARRRREGKGLPRPGARRDGASAHEKTSQEHGRDQRDEVKSGRGLPSRFRQRGDGRDGKIDGGGADLGVLGLGLGLGF